MPYIFHGLLVLALGIYSLPQTSLGETQKDAPPRSFSSLSQDELNSLKEIDPRLYKIATSQEKLKSEASPAMVKGLEYLTGALLAGWALEGKTVRDQIKTVSESTEVTKLNESVSYLEKANELQPSIQIELALTSSKRELNEKLAAPMHNFFTRVTDSIAQKDGARQFVEFDVQMPAAMKECLGTVYSNLGVGKQLNRLKEEELGVVYKSSKEKIAQIRAKYEARREQWEYWSHVNGVLECLSRQLTTMKNQGKGLPHRNQQNSNQETHKDVPGKRNRGTSPMRGTLGSPNYDGPTNQDTSGTTRGTLGTPKN